MNNQINGKTDLIKYFNENKGLVTRLYNQTICALPMDDYDSIEEYDQHKTQVVNMCMLLGEQSVPHDLKEKEELLDQQVPYDFTTLVFNQLFYWHKKNIRKSKKE